MKIMFYEKKVFMTTMPPPLTMLPPPTMLMLPMVHYKGAQ